MDEAVVRQQAQMYALVAEMNAEIAKLEAMKAANHERESQGSSLAYHEESFIEIAEKLVNIARKLRIEI